MTASEAVESLCAREVTAEEYAQAVVAQAELSACINAYAALNATKVGVDLALQQDAVRRVCTQPGTTLIQGQEHQLGVQAPGTCRCWRMQGQWIMPMRQAKIFGLCVA